MAEKMFKTLAVGYGSVASLVVVGAAYMGGGPLSWLLFAWLAGAPLTLIAAGLIASDLVPSGRSLFARSG